MKKGTPTGTLGGRRRSDSLRSGSDAMVEHRCLRARKRPLGTVEEETVLQS